MTYSTASAALALAATLAGEDFRWTHPAAPAQPNSEHRIGLTIMLAAAQGGICAACGEALAGERTDLCHIVPSRVSGRGTMPGNVYVGHASCNSDDAKIFANGIVPLASLIRADVVQQAHPTRKDCVSAARAVRATREARRAARLANM